MSHVKSIGFGRQFEDLTGMKFGRLVVVERRPSVKRKRYWLCRCDCGGTRTAQTQPLKDGRTKSCGCLDREQQVKTHTTHGRSRTAEYRTWNLMKMRCYRVKSQNYVRYGGAGVVVCSGWKNSFENFFADMGERPTPSHSIDRINGDIGYTCGHCHECAERGWLPNCRWATPVQQQRNVKSNHIVELGGVKRCIAEWAEITGISASTISSRLKAGWDAKTALTNPPRTNGRRQKHGHTRTSPCYC